MKLTQINYPESSPIPKSQIKSVAKYKNKVLSVMKNGSESEPEFALSPIQLDSAYNLAVTIKKKFKGVKLLILVGIGGSDLGTKAVYDACCDNKSVVLHCLNVIYPSDLQNILLTVDKVKNIKKLAICIISKSGKTTETIVNASVLLSALKKKFSKDIYKQTVFISNSDTDLVKWGNKLGGTIVTMPSAVGGRYSVSTVVGLVPLTIMGFAVDDFISGLKLSTTEDSLQASIEQAHVLAFYLKKGYQHYNFFTFNPRLEKLGAWYRQLLAESLGKKLNKRKQLVKNSFLPTISTPAELHSVGQLYFSKVNKVYTDFVTCNDSVDFALPSNSLLKGIKVRRLSQVGEAVYDGVLKAYKSQELPHRVTDLETKSLLHLGLFMGGRMLEVMFLADIMNINAFDQPNVELYKKNTKQFLGL